MIGASHIVITLFAIKQVSTTLAPDEVITTAVILVKSMKDVFLLKSSFKSKTEKEDIYEANLEVR
jgi:hypothetical protein